MNTISTFKATLMKRVLIALALFACIGTSVMAQTYRPLTGTRLLLNSTYPSGGRLTLQANPSSNYTLTFPASAPSANTVLIGSTSGTFDWFSFSNGLSVSNANTIELGGTLTKNTAIDLGSRTLSIQTTNASVLTQMSINANLSVTAGDGSIRLRAPNQSITAFAAGDVELGQLETANERSVLLLTQTQGYLKTVVGSTDKASVTTSFNGVDGTVSLEAANLEFLGAVSIDGSVVPVQDDNWDLGSDTKRWKDVYIGPSSLHIGKTSGSRELLIGYDDPTQTVRFNIDNEVEFLTMHTTNGLISKAKVTVGNGDAVDQLIVNTGGGENLVLSESSIARAEPLSLTGENGGPGSTTSTITLGKDLELEAADGDVIIKAENASGTNFTVETSRQASTIVNNGTEESLLNMDAGTETKLQHTSGGNDGTLVIDAATLNAELSSTVAGNTSAMTLAGGGNAAMSSTVGGGTASVTVTGAAPGTPSIVSLVGGVKVSHFVGAGPYIVENEVVVIITVAGTVTLPAHDAGRIVIVRNEDAITALDVVDAGNNVQLNLAVQTQATFFSAGNVWYVIGN